jgi:hypothetical protein
LKRLKKPVRVGLALLLSLFLFFFYIHSAKDAIITSAVVDANHKGVSVSLQNPYIIPIKVYDSSIIDTKENELPTKAYNVVLNGVSSGVSNQVNQEFMASQTEIFEQLEEVTVPSNTSKLEKTYSIFMTKDNHEGDMKSASQVTVSFKIFSFLPFKTTFSL